MEVNERGDDLESELSKSTSEILGIVVTDGYSMTVLTLTILFAVAHQRFSLRKI